MNESRPKDTGKKPERQGRIAANSRHFDTIKTEPHQKVGFVSSLVYMNEKRRLLIVVSLSLNLPCQLHPDQRQNTLPADRHTV